MFKNSSFGRFSTTSRLSDEYLRSEACYRQPETALATTKGPYTVFHNFVNSGPQTPKIGPAFVSTFRKRCTLLLCQPSFIVVTKLESTTLCRW